MMEVIGSTELGAAALQRQRPWVVMSALGMVGADGPGTRVRPDIRRQHTIICVSGYLFT